MPSKITLNSANSIIDLPNGIMRYNFPQNLQLSGDQQVSLVAINIAYSWINVDVAKFNNNAYQYITNTGAVRDVVLPDGYYTISQLDLYLKFIMDQNGDYLLDAAGTKIYFLSWAINSIYYSVTITSTIVPAILPAGWTNPNAMTLNDLGFQLQTIINNDFYKLLGLNVGANIYPPTNNISQAVNSPNIPDIAPQNIVNVDLNIIDNVLQLNRSVYSFLPNVAFGSYYYDKPSYPLFFDVVNGMFPYIEVRFTDDLGGSIKLQDISGLQVELYIV